MMMSRRRRGQRGRRRCRPLVAGQRPREGAPARGSTTGGRRRCRLPPAGEARLVLAGLGVVLQENLFLLLLLLLLLILPPLLLVLLVLVLLLLLVLVLLLLLLMMMMMILNSVRTGGSVTARLNLRLRRSRRPKWMLQVDRRLRLARSRQSVGQTSSRPATQKMWMQTRL